MGIAHRRSSRSASQRQWADDSIRDPRTTGRVGQTNLLSGPIVHYECQSVALSLRHRSRPVLVRAVAASMASGEVTRPVAASRPAMQGPSQDHRALVVGRSNGRPSPLSSTTVSRQHSRAARWRRWATSPRLWVVHAILATSSSSPTRNMVRIALTLCCSEYVNNAPSRIPLNRAAPSRWEFGCRPQPYTASRSRLACSFKYQSRR